MGISIEKLVVFYSRRDREQALRPVVVLRKFNNDIFLCVPLTSSEKYSKFYFEFFFNKRNNFAILSQIKLIDAKRLVAKIGMMSENDFCDMKRKISKLLKLTDFS